jgi:uncharacterized protein YndB with AHSA1/START domain
MPNIAPDGVGAVLGIGNATVLRFVRSFPASAEHVWDALTDTDRTAAWSFPATFEGGTGGTVTFTFGEGGVSSGTIGAWDPPRLLEYSYGESGQEWHLRMELHEYGAVTDLIFDHLAPSPESADFAAGWHWHLDRLAQHLAGQTPAQVFSDEAFDALLEYYTAR